MSAEASAVMQEAGDLQAARKQWLENGRLLQRTIELRQSAGLPIPAEVNARVAEWEQQGTYLEYARQELGDAQLGLIPLLVVGGAALATAVAGIFTARKAIGVQEQKAERDAEIIRMVHEGEITPDEGAAMTAGAAGGPSAMERLLGISPLMVAAVALTWAFGKPLLKKVFR